MAAVAAVVVMVAVVAVVVVVVTVVVAAVIAITIVTSANHAGNLFGAAPPTLPQLSNSKENVYVRPAGGLPGFQARDQIEFKNM